MLNIWKYLFEMCLHIYTHPYPSFSLKDRSLESNVTVHRTCRQEANGPFKCAHMNEIAKHNLLQHPLPIGQISYSRTHLKCVGLFFLNIKLKLDEKCIFF